MKVKVCDALCGSGKTSACIRMMNERADAKFIFVTQYLSEVEKIKSCCAGRKFVSPEGDLDRGYTKLANIHKLIASGENIATTHSLFISYTDETKRLIESQNYILILDETVDVLCMSDMEECDIEILKQSKTITEEDGTLTWLNDSYGEEGRGKFVEEMLRAKSKNLLKYDNEYFFWAIPPELFTCFKEAYVLTYLFPSQTLRCFFDLYGIDFDLIGVKEDERGYIFCPVDEMDRKRSFRDKIHILENEKLNSIGDPRTALSFTWYSKRNRSDDNGDLERMRKNMMNVFKNKWRAKGSEIMWTTFKNNREPLSSRGIIGAFVPYNKRASNDYREKKYLAYCVNNFPRPWEVKFFKSHGVRVEHDGYALSILVQWIFRSAIRNGDEVWVYIPSARMRNLLKEWINKIEDGQDIKMFDKCESNKRKGTTNVQRSQVL